MSDDHRGDREGDERELPAVDEEHGRDDDDRHDVLREEDQPVAEEEAHGLQVDRRPRHELPRLAAVVEAEREAQEVRVELVAHVVLDPSACRPEIIRRPNMSAPRTRPSATIAAIQTREHARVRIARRAR